MCNVVASLIMLTDGNGVFISVTRISEFDGFQEEYGSDEVLVPRTLKSIVPANPAIAVIRYTQTAAFVDAFDDGKLATSVISLDVEGLSSRKSFSPPVELSFDVVLSYNESSTFTCAYYNYEVLGWFSDGCVTVLDLSENV
jgi:hypothetical protein